MLDEVCLWSMCPQRHVPCSLCLIQEGFSPALQRVKDLSVDIMITVPFGQIALYKNSAYSLCISYTVSLSVYILVLTSWERENLLTKPFNHNNNNNDWVTEEWQQNPNGKDVESPMAQTQSSPVPTAYGRVEVGRSQDVAGLEADIWAMTDGDRAGGSDGADWGLIKLSNIAGAGDPCYVAVTSFRGGARVLGWCRCD